MDLPHFANKIELFFFMDIFIYLFFNIKSILHRGVNDSPLCHYQRDFLFSCKFSKTIEGKGKTFSRCTRYAIRKF